MRRFIGILLIIAAVSGIILSTAGIVGTWIYQPRVTRNVNDNLDLAKRVLNSTDEILSTVNQVVESTSTDVTSLQETTKAITTAIHDADPMLQTIMKLTGTDLPKTLDSTQSSIQSAQSSALLIDNVLEALTRVPFSPIAPYKPAVPLHTALGNVSTSLETLRPSLQTITSSLSSGRENLTNIETQLTSISDAAGGINQSLDTAKNDIVQYQSAVSQLKKNIENARQKSSQGILAAAVFLTLLFINLLVMDLALGLLGTRMLRREKIVEIFESHLPPLE